ncbi:T9SS type A sorting domain-containing protein [Chitinophaga filiformis]|uniref:LamG-like jellyroll fold domain-containing protein n=1 Tax=Chitinophaga filiformis TaxID=104663 RepID=UPI001F32C5F0|nr:LamG-like jellyroll fold domain-containing protein [Chitinophaga filiformis]MCF6407280.1 T9SS type A sorting domain-containing protein [Chitinophaga filiformis]
MKSFTPIAGLRLALFVLFLSLPNHLNAQFVAKKVRSGTGLVVPFLQYTPATHDASGPNRRYPLIIFLHGGGDIWSSDTSLAPGAPVWDVAGWGPMREIPWPHKMNFTWNNKTDTFIVLQPLSPQFTSWPPATIDAIIKYGTDSLKADTNRIYLSGHSWGGAGVFNYLNVSSANAKKLAAAVPIAAWNTGLHTNGPDNVSNARLPLWGFHAYDDPTTMRDTTIYSINRLNAVNPAVKPLLTIWPIGYVQTHPHHSAPEYLYSLHLHPYLEDGVLNIYEWFLGQNNDSLPNVLPVARVGNDTTILSSSGVANLNGSTSTDSDGTIVRYVWRKISGPAGGTIATPFGTASSTTVSGLTTAGVYKYQLNVVDHRAAIARDTLTITVVDTIISSGKAVTFTATGGRIIGGNVAEFKNASAFTVEAQFKYDSTNTDWSNAEASIFRNYVSSTDRIRLHVDKATRSVHFTIANGTDVKGYTASNVVSHDTWYHVAAVFDGAQTGNANRMKIYINGVAQTLTFTGTIPAITSGSTPSCIFGGEPSASKLSVIDEVRVWDTVLTASTINSWKNKLLGNCHPDFNHLFLYWPLDNDANPASAAAGLGTSYSSPIFYGNYINSTLALDTIPCPANSGKAVTFTATGGRIIGGNVTEFKNASAFTVEAQFKYDSTNTDWSNAEASIFRNYVSSTDRIRLYVDKATRSVHFTVANGADVKGYTASNVVSHDTWCHVAAVFDGAQTGNANRMKIYINGVAQTLSFIGTIPAITSGSTPSCIFGGEPSASKLSAIDEVRVWDTVLTSGTINSWKDKLLGNCHPNFNHLFLYWPLDNDANPASAAAGLGTSYSSPIFYGNYVVSNQATAASGCSGARVMQSPLLNKVEDNKPFSGKIYPNPTGGLVQLDVISKSAVSATVNVIDIFGRYLYRNKTLLTQGNNRISLNIASLPSGTYIVEIRDSNGLREKYKVLKR